MKVLVTGASGFLGRAVHAELVARNIQVTGLAFSRETDSLVKLDLNDFAATKHCLEERRPDVVVHCAAERKPDVCENSPDAAKNLNVHATENLAELSSSLDFMLLYISTDYVFPGDAPVGGYDVDDPPAPTNFYGKTKYQGEIAILDARRQRGARATVLRVPVLYGLASSNSESAINCLYDAVVAAADRKKVVRMDDWASRYPTNTFDVARVIVELAELSLERTLPSIVHFSAQQRLTKYEIAKIFALAHSPPLDLDEHEWFLRDGEGPRPGDTIRPRDCHLSNRALEGLGIDCTPAQTFEEWSKVFVEEQ
ncbi:hypothetical protein JCM11491_000951 [Sporobolomyces phaffii]